MAVHAQVVMALHNDARFLPDLFERLKATGPGDEGWQDQVAFLQELTGLAKHLQPAHRQQLLAKLASLGLFEACFFLSLLFKLENKLEFCSTYFLPKAGHHTGAKQIKKLLSLW